MSQKKRPLTISSLFGILTLTGAIAIAPVTSVQASPYTLQLRSVVNLDPEEEVDGADEADEADEAAAADGDEAPDPGTSGETSLPPPAAGPPMGPPPKKGLGMMISGAVITGAYALPLTAYGIFIIAASRSVDDETGLVEAGGNLLGGVALTFGLIGLAVGGPLLGVGAARFSKYRKWQSGQQVRLIPTSGRTAHGTWTQGLAIRF